MITIRNRDMARFPLSGLVEMGRRDPFRLVVPQQLDYVVDGQHDPTRRAGPRLGEVARDQARFPSRTTLKSRRSASNFQGGRHLVASSSESSEQVPSPPSRAVRRGQSSVVGLKFGTEPLCGPERIPGRRQRATVNRQRFIIQRDGPSSPDFPPLSRETARCPRRRAVVAGDSPASAETGQCLGRRRVLWGDTALSADDGPSSPDFLPLSRETARRLRRRAVVARDSPASAEIDHCLETTARSLERYGIGRWCGPSSPDFPSSSRETARRPWRQAVVAGDSPASAEIDRRLEMVERCPPTRARCLAA